MTQTPPRQSYRGGMNLEGGWPDWSPRAGDILVVTPSKSGTTWTQTMLAMLLHGGPDLPDRVGALSPWIDTHIGRPVADRIAALEAQPGRRVVKTHTPADGVPVVAGVTTIAVYRHPLDVFFSLRKHVANRADAPESHPLAGEVSEALERYLTAPADPGAWNDNDLASVAHHYRRTVLDRPHPETHVFHYADMTRDPRAAVSALAGAAGIEANPSLIDAVAEATGFEAMKASAARFAPMAGDGIWRSDTGFFDAGTSNKWEGALTGAQVAAFEARLSELIPEPEARDWLKWGEARRPA